jgi:hypothetical protein
MFGDGNCSPPRVTTGVGEVEDVEEAEDEDDEVPDVSSLPTPVR